MCNKISWLLSINTVCILQKALHIKNMSSPLFPLVLHVCSCEKLKTHFPHVLVFLFVCLSKFNPVDEIGSEGQKDQERAINSFIQTNEIMITSASQREPVLENTSCRKKGFGKAQDNLFTCVWRESQPPVAYPM